MPFRCWGGRVRRPPLRTVAETLRTQSCPDPRSKYTFQADRGRELRVTRGYKAGAVLMSGFPYPPEQRSKGPHNRQEIAAKTAENLYVPRLNG